MYVRDLLEIIFKRSSPNQIGWAGEEAPRLKSGGRSRRGSLTPPHTWLRPLGKHVFSDSEGCIRISLSFGERGLALSFHIYKMGLTTTYHQGS